MQRGRIGVHALILPAFTLTVLAIFAVIYAADPAAYLRILSAWGFVPLAAPFIDTATLISQIRCSFQGIDAYVANPCIILGVPFDYSPLWLRMTFIPPLQPYASLVGLALAIAAALSLAALPPPRTRRALIVMGLAILSPMTLFALERGNADVLMFIIVIAGIVLIERPGIANMLGYAAFLLAALLKFYPLVLMARLLREPPRRAIAGILITLGVVCLFVAVYWPELLRALGKIPYPSPFGDGFGAEQFPFGLGVLLRQPLLVPIARVALWAAAILTGLHLSRLPGFATGLDSMAPRALNCLSAGALVIGGCFFAESNIGYRGIFLLPVLPGLMLLASRPAAPLMLAYSPHAMLVSMWMLAPLRYFGPKGAGPAFVGPLPFFGLWFVREILWWWLAAILLAILFGAFLAPATRLIPAKVMDVFLSRRPNRGPAERKGLLF